MASLLHQQRNKAGPAGLMRGTDAAPGVAVEIFVKEHVFAEGGIVAMERGVAENRPFAVGVEQKKRDKRRESSAATSPRLRNLPDRGGIRRGSRRRNSGSFRLSNRCQLLSAASPPRRLHRAGSFNSRGRLLVMRPAA
jgi:hypothetical protein